MWGVDSGAFADKKNIKDANAYDKTGNGRNNEGRQKRWGGGEVKKTTKQNHKYD